MNTEKLLHAITQASTVSEALRFVEDQSTLTPISQLLGDVLACRQVSPQQLATLIDMERSTLYRLLNGERLTTRNVLLRIALALNMNLEETQTLLRSGHRAELYALVRRDALIIFCIERGYSLEKTETELLRKNEASLYERV